VDRITQRIPPQELVTTVQRGDIQGLADQLELDTDRANRILLQLKDKPAVFNIEVVDMHDRPSIKLADGPDYKDSSALSTGQKCTTILPILLLETASPLLIDQPEDNLDNAFIYETVVKSVRGVRGKRQLIFVTHNPNIPVLGDAERVVVLQSNGRMASVKAVGTVDEVKAEIETVLEGGKEAFQRRKERYGY
jgi:ABC-type lipoprotein export system ATPase subunit